MSYCRWSTDDFRCDLYVYADVSGGYTIHVAAKRWDFPIPPEWAQENTPSHTDPAWVTWHVERDKALAPLREATPHTPIGLAHDGETFHEGSAEGAVARLKMLREAGYRFPDYVIEDIEAEQEQED